MIEGYINTTIPEFTWPNFNYMFRDITSNFADRMALRYRCRGEKAFQEWTYARMGREGGAFASFLLAKGLAKGDRVAIWSENRPEWGVAYMATLAAGLVAVPIDALIPDEDVARIFKTAEIQAVVASGKFSKGLASLVAPIESARVLIGLDGAPEGARASHLLRLVGRGGVLRGRARPTGVPRRSSPAPSPRSSSPRARPARPRAWACPTRASSPTSTPRSTRSPSPRWTSSCASSPSTTPTRPPAASSRPWRSGRR